MTEYVDGPQGNIRVPDELGEARRANGMYARVRGREVELLYLATSLDPASEDDGAVSEAVARIFMPRDEYEKLVVQMAQGLVYWQENGY